MQKLFFISKKKIMPLSKNQKNSIKDIIKNSLKNRFQKYNPEPASMPFHKRLLGKE